MAAKRITRPAGRHPRSSTAGTHAHWFVPGTGNMSIATMPKNPPKKRMRDVGVLWILALIR